ncbi:MAG: hypothetical protein C4332_14785 [Meiothermus sp.]
MRSDFWLQEMRQAALRVLDYTAGLEFADFVGDSRTYDAVLFNLERLGLAASRVPPEERDGYAELPWEQLTSLSQIFIRLHFGVQDEIVWNLIKSKLPKWLSLLAAPKA